LHAADVLIALGRSADAIGHLKRLEVSRTATVHSRRLARQRLRTLKSAR
jgi:hypothetical protein